MTSPADFHISISSPDNTVFPSFKLSEFGSPDASKVLLSAVREKCKISGKFKFSADGKTALVTDYDLAYYVSITPENHAKIFGTSPATAAKESGGTVSSPGTLQSGSQVSQETGEPGAAPPAQTTSTSNTGAAQTTPTSKTPIPTIVIQLILSTIHPTQNVPIGDLGNQLRSLTSTAKDDLTVRSLASLADSMPKLAALSTSFAATPSSVANPEPADLTGDKWLAVLFNTQVLAGFNVGADGVGKSTYNAFDLVDQTDPSHTTYPDFILHDDSSVTVTELQTAFQISLAQQSFSSKTVEASVSASAFGFSVSASTSYDRGEATASLSKKTTTADSMHVSYNFPRVILFLRPDKLALTTECHSDATKVTNQAEKDAFFEKYGLLIATQVTLGGRLHSTTSLTDNEKQNVQDKKTSLRVAAAVSFGSPWVSASASYAQTNNNATQNDTNSMAKNLTMTWDAHGGDTLLCSNPPAWAETVKDYRLWRVMDQTKVVSLESLIKQVDPVALSIEPVLGKPSALTPIGDLQRIWTGVENNDDTVVHDAYWRYKIPPYNSDQLHQYEASMGLRVTKIPMDPPQQPDWNDLTTQERYNIVRNYIDIIAPNIQH